MEAIATREGVGFRRIPGFFDFPAIAVWLLGFVLVVYLGLEGGGYDPIIRDQLGIVVWWGVLLGVVVGALPLSRLRYRSLAAVGLLAAYVTWVTLSASWSTSPEGGIADAGRVATYLGVFALALSLRTSKGARRMIGAVGTAIAVISVVGLLSRLHPAWFPSAGETSEFLPSARDRLAYPLGYWNGVASLTAIGLPLVLYLATSARRIAVQAVAASALPAMLLTVYFTLSRGGSIASFVAVILFLCLAWDRLPKAATAAVTGVGGAILIQAAIQRHALNSGLSTPLAHSQGDELLAMTLVVCAGVGLIQAGLAIALAHGQRPTWSEPSRRTSLRFGASASGLLIILVIAAGATGTASKAWHEFKEAKGVGNRTTRLGSFSSNGRWPYWRSTLKENATAPLVGTGSGSFEAWWAAHGNGGFVRDAHSLYFETLGELGIVGLALLIAFLGWVLAMGVRHYLRAVRGGRTRLGACLATCIAFCLGAGADWLWELAVVPIAFLLIASVVVNAETRRRKGAAVPIWARVTTAVAALMAMAVIAIPLGAAASLQASQAAARSGELTLSLRDARNARRVEPFAGLPRIQEALVLEAERRLVAAGAAARAATEREPEQWRAWLIRSRIEAEQGNAAAALAFYQRARSLNPHSALFG